MANQQMPQAGAPIATKEGLCSRAWYLFFNGLSSSLAGLGLIAPGKLVVGGATPGTLAGGNLSGDVTTSNTTVTTLATVNSNVGTFGDSTHVSRVTVNGKGLITAASSVAIAAGGTVTTTGSPAAGNLTKFSGATSITNGDLSGDVATTGTLVTTLATVNSNVGTFGDSTHVGQFTVNGKGLITAASNVALSSSGTAAIGITMDGAGAVLTTGVKGFVYVPKTCTITAVTLLSTDASVLSGSIVVDIWKDVYANYPPTVADTIINTGAGGVKPTISSATNSQDTTLAHWTTSVTAGDVIGFNVDSVTTLQRVTLELTVTY